MSSKELYALQKKNSLARKDAEVLRHPPKSQIFKSYGLTYRWVGPERWHVEGHGEMSSKELYALQKKNSLARKDAERDLPGSSTSEGGYDS